MAALCEKCHGTGKVIIDDAGNTRGDYCDCVGGSLLKSIDRSRKRQERAKEKEELEKAALKEKAIKSKKPVKKTTAKKTAESIFYER